MKSIAFTDEDGDRHIVYARDQEAIEAVESLCTDRMLEYEIDPEDA